jgi:NitT/TauT family transport system substrate-binding protein
MRESQSITRRHLLAGSAALAGAAGGLLPAPTVRAQAAQDVKIGIGFGIGFLPTFLLDELKLVEKHGQAAGLNLKATYHRFSGSAAMQDAVLSGSVDYGVYGVAAQLIAWERAKGSPQQIFSVAGVTTQPLVLLTNKPNTKKLADFEAKDRIAMPALISPQMYALQMQAEKEFGVGQHDKLKTQVVALPHPDALNALTSGGGEVTAYFSAAPFTQVALKNPKVSKMFTSNDVFGGKATFLAMSASKKTLDANDKLAAVMIAALGEAHGVIKSDPKRAAEIYLKVEPSKTMDNAAVEALLKEMASDFDTGVHGVKMLADFMGRIGQLKAPPARWQDTAAPALHNVAGS